MSDGHEDGNGDRDRTGGKPANTAPDAVKDPNEKTEGKPGLGPKGGGTRNEEADPGGG